SGTLTSRSAGRYLVTLIASDGSRMASANFIWTIADPTPPQVTIPPNQTNPVGTLVSSFFIQASDADRDPMALTVTGLPTGLKLKTTAGLIFGRLTARGTFHVTITVTDGTNKVSGSFTWTVV